jgi:hypothetical protein
MGYDPNDLPSGWGGGLRTLDVYAAGTVATGSNGQLTSYMNATGVHTTQNMTAGGNITATLDINGQNLSASNNISANQNVNAGRYVYIGGIAKVGETCTPNGAQGRTSEGGLLSCINGTWAKQKYTYKTYTVNFSSASDGASEANYARQNMGSHLLCYLTGEQSSPLTSKHALVYQSGSNWILEMRVTRWYAGANTWNIATCVD